MNSGGLVSCLSGYNGGMEEIPIFLGPGSDILDIVGKIVVSEEIALRLVDGLNVGRVRLVGAIRVCGDEREVMHLRFKVV